MAEAHGEDDMDVRQVVRALAWTTGGLILLATALLAVLVAVNWNDRPPSGDTLRLDAVLDADRDVPAEENGFVFVLGMSVPIDEDPAAWGLRRASWLKARVGRALVDGAALPGEDHDLRGMRTPANAMLAGACGDDARACGNALAADDGRSAAWLADEAWLLDRYRLLLARRYWVEAAMADPRAPLPAYAFPMDGQKLWLLDAHRRAREGDADAVRSMLEEDLRFWRMAHRDSQLLISRMVAVAAIRRHFMLGSMVLAALPPDQIADAVPPAWRAPFTAQERSMLRSMAGEWRWADAVVRLERSDPAALSGATEGARRYGRAAAFFLQPQDTSNRHAARIIRFVDRLDVGYAAMPAALQAARTEFFADSGLKLQTYNPVGTALLGVGGDFGRYAAHSSDLEGVRRLALLAAELQAERIGPDEIEEAVRLARLRNPYTGAPFEWSDADRLLTFIGLAGGSDRRYAIAL